MNINITIAQRNFLLGDISFNTQQVINDALFAKSEYASDLIVFPELTLTGYPPEDLLFRPDLHEQISLALDHIAQHTKGIDIVVGYPHRSTSGLYNAAAWIRDGLIIATYRKQHLPNYGVFDEKRYFITGDRPCVVTLKGTPIAVSICEDLWVDGPIQQAAKAGARLMLSLNASPFDKYKSTMRESMIANRAQQGNMPIVYTHWAGAQDDLVFDGGSMLINPLGKIVYHAGYFNEGLFNLPINIEQLNNITEVKHPSNDIECIYHALVMGVRDYVNKNNFSSAILGSSGGIDSAVTLCIAVEALGHSRVKTYMLPSEHTSKISLDTANELANNLNVKHETIPIHDIFQSCLSSLQTQFSDTFPDITEENLQARCRGILLMALSNKFGGIVLTTGNKSELAVGYCTLYGDMAGGFAVLKDVPKTLVYALADYINRHGEIIPQKIIDRPPSAELSPDQKDSDHLPPYSELDQILALYVEEDNSVEEIVEAGFDHDTVKQVIHLVDKSEYKRRQSPPGVRISHRAFGRERRYPITSGFKHK